MKRKRAKNTTETEEGSASSSLLTDNEHVAESIKKDLLAIASPTYATTVKRFFKTAYCPDDIFIGLRVPQCRTVVMKHCSKVCASVVQELLDDERHEVRSTGLMLLANAYESNAPSWNVSGTDLNIRGSIVTFYLGNTAKINNWDLVDVSCTKIVGAWLLNDLDIINQVATTKLTAKLDSTDSDFDAIHLSISKLPAWYSKLILSSDFWETRISIVSLLAVKNANVDFVLLMCLYQMLRLIKDDYTQFINGLKFKDYDLVHKAIGWVIRECGKVSKTKMIKFMDRNISIFPKTTAR
jgi:3-methyladenine DNA glycosylase AlkD